MYMSDQIVKIRDTVSLEHGSYKSVHSDVWTLYYYDLRGLKVALAEFTQGPLQSSLMVAAARAAVKWKLLDDFDIVADEVQVARLLKLMPDLAETPPTTAPFDSQSGHYVGCDHEQSDNRICQVCGEDLDELALSDNCDAKWFGTFHDGVYVPND